MATPGLASVGGRPPARHAEACRSRHAGEGDPTPGRRLCRWRVDSAAMRRSGPIRTRCCRAQGALWGHGPPNGDACTGHGHHAWLGVVPAGDAPAGPLTSPSVGLPTAVLERVWQPCQTPLQRAPDLRGGARGPSAFEQGAAGMGLTGRGEGARPATRTTGRCRGRQSQVPPERSGMLHARQLTHGRDEADGHQARHATPAVPRPPAADARW